MEENNIPNLLRASISKSSVKGIQAVRIELFLY